MRHGPWCPVSARAESKVDEGGLKFIQGRPEPGCNYDGAAILSCAVETCARPKRGTVAVASERKRGQGLRVVWGPQLSTETIDAIEEFLIKHTTVPCPGAGPRRTCITAPATGATMPPPTTPTPSHRAVTS